MCAALLNEEDGFSILSRPLILLGGGRWHHLTNRNELNL